MVSIKFRDIANHEITIARYIYENQSILRYMYYLSNDPLSDKTINDKGEIVLQPDLDITFDEAHISLQSYDEKILSTKHCSMFIYPLHGTMYKRKTLGDITYAIDIICPKDFQMLWDTTEYRDFCIADEIAEMIDGKMVTGIGDVEILDWKSGRLEKDYTYLSLFVNVKNFTVKGCHK